MPSKSVVCCRCDKEQRGPMIRQMRKGICKSCRSNVKKNIDTELACECESKEQSVEAVEHRTPVKQVKKKRKLIEITTTKVKGAAVISPRQLRRRSGELSKVIDALAGPGEKNQMYLVSHWMKRKKRLVEQ